MKKLLCFILLALLSVPALAQSAYHNCSNTDLDSVFAPWHSGWPQAAATGYHVSGGGDLNGRYAPLSTGTAVSGSTCNHIAGGADFNTVFAALGSTSLSISTQPSAVSGSTAAGRPSGTVTSNTTSCAAIHGNSGAYSYSWHIVSGSGTATAASSATSAVTGTVSAGTTNTGTWYCEISDGVTSANTNTVGWSLQNTTPPSWSYSGTITVGTGANLAGFISGEFGSLSPTTINGNTIDQLVTNTAASETTFSVAVASDPGQAIFTTLQSGLTTKLSSAASYTYSGGIASWSWSGNLYSTSGAMIAITIN